MLAAGKTHACGLSIAGKLSCWGAGATAITEAPSDIVSLAAGENTTCALTSNGKLKCWGDNADRLGKLDLMAFVAVTAKGKTICGVLEKNYSLICWGTGGGAAPAVVFDRVLPGPCVQSCPCGVLLGSGDLCFAGVICRPCIPVNVNGAAVPPTQTSGDDTGVRQSDHQQAFIVAGGTGLGFAFVIVTCLLVRQRCRRRIAPLPALQPQHRRCYDIEKFSFQTLSSATDNFSHAQKIGSGSFGSVYRANLDDGRSAAVKRAEHHAETPYKERAFCKEISLLSRLHHKNLINLLGFCDAAGELILVYEHCSNGSLADHIYRSSSSISTWKMRLQIALDAARALQYLHVYAEPPVLHRDIKPSNILLTGTMTAKLADFGLSLESPTNTMPSQLIAGTLGYMDPESYRLQELTDKSDMYSFGVVLLELLTGYKAVLEDELTGELQNIVNVFVPKIQAGHMEHVLDKKLPPPLPCEIEAVTDVAYLAAGCVSMDCDDRPSISEVVIRIEVALSALNYSSVKCIDHIDQCGFTEAR